MSNTCHRSASCTQPNHTIHRHRITHKWRLPTSATCTRISITPSVHQIGTQTLAHPHLHQRCTPCNDPADWRGRYVEGTSPPTHVHRQLRHSAGVVVRDIRTPMCTTKGCATGTTLTTTAMQYSEPRLYDVHVRQSQSIVRLITHNACTPPQRAQLC
jgi:hypothetical protein